MKKGKHKRAKQVRKRTRTRTHRSDGDPMNDALSVRQTLLAIERIRQWLLTQTDVVSLRRQFIERTLKLQEVLRQRLLNDWRAMNPKPKLPPQPDILTRRLTDATIGLLRRQAKKDRSLFLAKYAAVLWREGGNRDEWVSVIRDRAKVRDEKFFKDFAKCLLGDLSCELLPNNIFKAALAINAVWGNIGNARMLSKLKEAFPGKKITGSYVRKLQYDIRRYKKRAKQ